MESIIFEVLAQFSTLLGVAALLALLVNVGKHFGIVKDGYGGSVFAALQLVAMAALVYLRLYSPLSLEQLDAKASELANAGMIVFGYLVSLKFGSSVHNQAVEAKIPVLGFSHFANKGWDEV